MTIPKISLEIDLKNPVAEIREIIQALEKLADNLESIEEKYKTEGEEE